MKRILTFIFCLFIFISCNKKDEYSGTWIAPDWKRDTETIIITENGKNNYIVNIKSSFGTTQEFVTTEKDGILNIDMGIFSYNITIDKNTHELLADNKRFIKLTPKLQKEIDKYFEELREEIIGNWEYIKEDSVPFSNKKEIIHYKYEITPLDDKKSFKIRATLSSEKNTLVSEKEISLEITGYFKTVKKFTQDSLFTTFYLFDNVESLKKLDKIK